MKKDVRKAVIAGNWKMNKTPAETTAFIAELKPLVADATCDVVICVPFVDLQNALEATKALYSEYTCHQDRARIHKVRWN